MNWHNKFHIGYTRKCLGNSLCNPTWPKCVCVRVTECWTHSAADLSDWLGGFVALFLVSYPSFAISTIPPNAITLRNNLCAWSLESVFTILFKIITRMKLQFLNFGGTTVIVFRAPRIEFSLYLQNLIPASLIERTVAGKTFPLSNDRELSNDSYRS